MRSRRKQSKYRRKLALLVDPSAGGEDPADNLRMLLDAARASAAFGAVDFEAPVWKVTGLKCLSPSRPAKQMLLHFTRLPPHAPSRSPVRIPMRICCEQLAKSMLRLAHDADPLSYSKATQFLSAIYKLDTELTAEGRGIADCTTGDFEAVIERLEAEGRTPDSLNATMQGLAAISCVVDTYRLSRSITGYRPHYHWAGNDVRPDEVVDALLPTEAALAGLDALAKAIADLSVRGKVLAWVIVLLFLAPFRVSEVLHLALDCEVFADSDDCPLTEADWHLRPSEVRYGLRYFNLKSGQDDVKWFATDDAPLTREIIAQVRDATAEAREIAARVARRGGPAFAAELLLVDRLTVSQVAEILKTDSDGARTWLDRNGIPITPANVKTNDLRAGLEAAPCYKRAERVRADRVVAHIAATGGPTVDVETLRPILAVNLPHRWLRTRGVAYEPDTVARSNVEDALMRAHRETPDDFPIRLEEMLFVFPSRFFDSRCEPLDVTASPMTKDHVRRFLTGDINTCSIFDMLDAYEPDASPIHLTPMMFRRHTLTLAKNAGLGAAHQARLLNHRTERALPRYALTRESEALASARDTLTDLAAYRGSR